MDSRKIDINKHFSKKNSSRHHYIPQFLIEGFTNNKGQVYVYDKLKNKILSKPQSPKSIFFETDRNTVEINDVNQTSVLEDVFYSTIDDKASKIVKEFQSDHIKSIEFTNENIAQFNFFVINLFWRIPYSDYAAQDVLNRSEIISDKTNPEIIKKDPTFQKMSRASLFKHTIDEMAKEMKDGSKIFVNIHQGQSDCLILGDNPILYKKRFYDFSQFGSTDYLFPLSSKRVFSSTEACLEKLTDLNYKAYNAFVIDQSIRYVVSGRKELLENSISLYNQLGPYKTRALRAKIFEPMN